MILVMSSKVGAMVQWPWRKKRVAVDEYGRSPLWHHAASGDVAALEARLRQTGGDATAADKDGFTALHIAAQNGHGQIVRALVRARADVNAVDRHGNGPLWTASRQASLAVATEPSFVIVELLLGAGADPHHINNAGRSPLMWASTSPKLAERYAAAGVSLVVD